jgi:hypothetical protein
MIREGPLAARDPRVGNHWSTCCILLVSRYLLFSQYIAVCVHSCRADVFEYNENNYCNPFYKC